MKKFIFFLTLVVFALSGCASSTITEETVGNISDRDWVQGSQSASVTLIEYADFQCPICTAYHPLIDQLLQKYPGKFRFVYRFFPLLENHPNALSSAKAAQAAGLQGKFFEMSDLLFRNQEAWASSSDALSFYRKYAAELQLDSVKFEKDFHSSEVEARVRADLADAIALQLPGTPFFYLNGKKLIVRSSDFFPYLENVLQSSSTQTTSPAVTPSGTPAP